jgi:CBS domain containing-hemolysin-like protein
MILVLWIFLLGCVAFSAYFSASEVALFSLSSMQVRAYTQSNEPDKVRVARLLKRPADLLVTLLVLNTISNLLIQNTISSISGEYSGWLIHVGIPLGITLIFGEIIPKSIGIVKKEVFAIRVASSLHSLEKFFAPVRFILIKVTQWIAPWEFFFLRKKPQISSQELRHALQTSCIEGILHSDEAELIRGYLQLKEASVKEMMRPRDEVLFYGLQEPLETLVHLFVDEQCSKLPVSIQGLDEVIGIIDATSYFLHAPKILNPQDIIPYVKKPFFVPEVLPALSLLRKFYERKESLALVIDEYSSVSGLVTLEDIVESVIGEIFDRREKQKFTRSGEDVIIASGKFELVELQELWGITLENPNHMVTIGGWLTAELGDIPKSGVQLERHGLLFHVLASAPNRVRRIYIRRLTS